MKSAIVALVALTAVTGCTIERTVVEQAPTTTEARERTTTTEADAYYAPDEEGFIWFIEDQVGSIAGLESDALETGYMVCELAAGGTTLEEFAVIARDSASDEEGYFFLTTVTAAALAYLCMEYGLQI